MDNAAIHVQGLDELRRKLSKADKRMARELGQAGKAAADIVAKDARLRVPARSGRARKSVRAVAARGGGAVKGGGKTAEYYPWLEFGGRVGRRRSVVRKPVKEGRYIYPSLARNRDRVRESYADGVRSVLKSNGLI